MDITISPSLTENIIHDGGLRHFSYFCVKNVYLSRHVFAVPCAVAVPCARKVVFFCPAYPVTF